MPGKPLYRRSQAFGLCNSSLGHTVRQKKVELTNSAAQAPPLLSPATSSSFLWPETNRNEHFETAFGSGSSVPDKHPILIAGLLLKRLVDISLCTMALFVSWPLLLAIALAVKLGSPGPIIYASPRAGKKGQVFFCYKFRTMLDGADGLRNSLREFNERQDPFFKIADDPRVTRLGRFLRKHSLDELPQFWNVLKGEMSLVGPRPHPVDDCTRYRPEDHRRLEVKPGITGLWQVIARTNPSFETCITMDMEYMRSWSLLLDLKILMRTVPTVLSGDGQ
jgi:lipopolysaccharide/colanic/teichoic acid biosynthesis glycosyltransferase